jgi:hypothetical protein
LGFLEIRQAMLELEVPGGSTRAIAAFAKENVCRDCRRRQTG